MMGSSWEKMDFSYLLFPGQQDLATFNSFFIGIPTDIPTDLGEISGLDCGKFVFLNTRLLQSSGKFNIVSQGDWRMIKCSETATRSFPYSLHKIPLKKTQTHNNRATDRWIINNAGAFVKSLFPSASSTPWPCQLQTVKDRKDAPDWQITLWKSSTILPSPISEDLDLWVFNLILMSCF